MFSLSTCRSPDLGQPADVPAGGRLRRGRNWSRGSLAPRLAGSRRRKCERRGASLVKEDIADLSRVNRWLFQDQLPGTLLRRLNPVRSEEHTSELQSLRHLVCRLL